MNPVAVSAGQQEAGGGRPLQSDVRAPRIRFHCPSCHILLEVSADLTGVSGPCPGCGQVINAPEGLASSAPENELIQQSGESLDSPREVQPGVPPEAFSPPSSRGGGKRPGPESSAPVASSKEEVCPPQRRRRKREEPKRVREEGRSRPGHVISPGPLLSDRAQEREETVAVIKFVLALVLTLATVIVVVKVTQKGFATPPPATPAEMRHSR